MLFEARGLGLHHGRVPARVGLPPPVLAEVWVQGAASGAALKGEPSHLPAGPGVSAIPQSGEWAGA